MNGTAVPVDPPDPVQRSVQAGEGIYESLLLDQQGPLASVADPDPSDPHVFGLLGLLDPDLDPLTRGMDPDPDPSITKQK